jgi:MFS family permease
MAEMSDFIFRSLGRALRNRNYRLFFAGQAISLVGTWLTRVASSWLVYRLTGSAMALGIVGFAGQIPTFVIAPLAGVLVDRCDRQRVLIGTQALAGIQSAILAALTLGGVITVRDVVLLSLFQGLINAVDIPARQAFVVDMIESREDLPNAVALNSSIFNAARLVGPSIGGVLIASVGEGLCFLLDAISYLAVIAALAAMKLHRRPRTGEGESIAAELVEGFRYVWSSPAIRAILLLLAVVTLLGTPHIVLMPIIASEVLHGGPHTLGVLMAASGFGALAGALYMASRSSVIGLGAVIAGSSAAFGIAQLIFAASRVLSLSLAAVAFAGMALIVQMAASNTIVQTIAEEDKRGRVMSFYAIAFAGSAPLGSLFAGALATRIGAPMTILCGGVGCALAALEFRRRLPELRRVSRPLYVRLGILPEAAP